jgi:serine protease Do
VGGRFRVRYICWALLALGLVGLGLLPLRSEETIAPPPVSSNRPRPDVRPLAGAMASGRGWNLRQTPVVEVVRRVRDAVVNIHSERTAQGARTEELFSLTPSQHRVNGMGTGIVIDPRGYIITNQHVVEDVHTLRIRLQDGTSYPARVLCRDGEADLALLKVEPHQPMATIPLGTSSDLMVGETVIAVGNAYGYEHSVTVGVVSAVARDVTLNKDVSYKALIQTDASINPGNSGGPLLNVYGEVVGVNVAIRAGAQGIGFALPVDSVVKVTAALLAQASTGIGGDLAPGRRERRIGLNDIYSSPNARAVGGRAATGITLRDQVRPHGDNPLAEGADAEPVRSAVVDAVEPDSPAARAGVRAGDVLLQVGDVPCVAALDFERALLDDQGRERGSERVALRLRRDGRDVRAQVALEAAEPVHAEPVINDRPAPAGGAPADLLWRRIGLRAQSVGADSVSASHPQLRGGLVILEVREGSAADRGGIRRGDILVGLHQWEMLNIDNVFYVLNHPDLATFSPVKFYILRGDQVNRGLLPVE